MVDYQSVSRGGREEERDKRGIPADQINHSTEGGRGEGAGIRRRGIDDPSILNLASPG